VRGHEFQKRLYFLSLDFGTGIAGCRTCLVALTAQLGVAAGTVVMLRLGAGAFHHQHKAQRRSSLPVHSRPALWVQPGSFDSWLSFRHISTLLD